MWFPRNEYLGMLNLWLTLIAGILWWTIVNFRVILKAMCVSTDSFKYYGNYILIFRTNSKLYPTTVYAKE